MKVRVLNHGEKGLQHASAWSGPGASTKYKLTQRLMYVCKF